MSALHSGTEHKCMPKLKINAQSRQEKKLYQMIQQKVVIRLQDSHSMGAEVSTRLSEESTTFSTFVANIHLDSLRQLHEIINMP